MKKENEKEEQYIRVDFRMWLLLLLARDLGSIYFFQNSHNYNKLLFI